MTDTRTIIEMTEGSEEDKMFEGALNSVLHMDKKDYPAYIGGLMVASGHEFIVSSPIDESIRFGQFQEPEDDIADHAVEASRKAFAEWSKTDQAKRAGIFEMVLDSIKRQRYRLAAAVTISSGMTRSRALNEVDMLIASVEREVVKVRGGQRTRPAGVWAIVSEHNSPLAVPISNAIAAMLAGNVVIMMPSRYVPIPIYMIYDILKNAMLPGGVMNIIVDRRGKATEKLLAMEVAGITAVGSGARMEEMMFLQMDDQLKFVNEIKGMNPILVNRPSNMKQVAETIIARAFEFAGQDLDACSKVVVIADDQKQFMDAILKAAQSIKVGDPVERDTTVGPIVSKDAMEEFLNIYDEIRDTVIFGGKRVLNDETMDGYYVMPMISMGLPIDHEMNNIDHSLPILSIQIAADMEEAMDMINGCEFGRSASIYTKDENISKQFTEIAVADNIIVNDLKERSVEAKVEWYSR